MKKSILKTKGTTTGIFMTFVMILLVQGTEVVGLFHCADRTAEAFHDTFQQVFLKKAFRPSGDANSPTSVNLSITLYAILGVNEKEQLLTTFLSIRMLWFNDFAKWDPEECGAIKEITVPIEKMWVPDIFIQQFVDEDRYEHLSYLTVDHTGLVRYLKPMRVVSSCNLNIFQFPFDIQNCSLTFGSSLNTAQHIILGLLKTNGSVEQISSEGEGPQGEWELVQIEPSDPGNMQNMVAFNIIIKRRPVLYVVNLLLPSAFLMLIDIFSFNLPPHGMDRATFKMTLLLGYMVFILIINDLLPATSSGTPLIGIYVSLCLALLVIGLLETVFIMNILYKGSLTSPHAPIWLHTLVLHYISLVVCYKTQALFDTEQQQNTICKAAGDKYDMEASQETSIHGKQPQIFLSSISDDLHTIRQQMEGRNKSRKVEEQWLQIGLILDALVYRLYLFFMVVYAVVLGAIWATWYQA
ncbi:5-hydroxytryptamine receptor 3A-like isoform X2 [Dendrobates tinctorius]|uniref:5-hydroxytryptamine receptor 3A-like isoform X2 n=1 Tax=Dendrobates tinctorius TaxID=92724 RepID=UPI003CC94591